MKNSLSRTLFGASLVAAVYAVSFGLMLTAIFAALLAAAQHGSAQQQTRSPTPHVYQGTDSEQMFRALAQRAGAHTEVGRSLPAID